MCIGMWIGFHFGLMFKHGVVSLSAVCNTVKHRAEWLQHIQI